MQDKHKASLAEIEARRRVWVIGELMRDDRDLSRSEAEALYDEAGREALPYVIWSNEHKAWWGPSRRGYVSSFESAGRYTREEAVRICTGARGGRQFNENPSEVPILAEDAKIFWPDDKPEWRRERHAFKAQQEDDIYG